MADRDFKGVWIPKAVWLDERLNALDKCILVEIDSLDQGEGCWASNERLAQFCQCSVTKVSTSISKLIEFQYLSVVSFDGRKRFLKSSLSEIESQPFKNCKAAFQNLKDSNTDNNTTSMEQDEDECSAPREVSIGNENPYGERDGEEDGLPRRCAPRNDGDVYGEESVQRYAVNNLVTLSPRGMEELNGYADDLGEDIVRHAIDNALDNGVRKWSYVRAILMDYLTEGVKSVGEAKAYDERRRKRKQGRDGPHGNPFGLDRRNNRVPERMGKGIVV